MAYYRQAKHIADTIYKNAGMVDDIMLYAYLFMDVV